MRYAEVAVDYDVHMTFHYHIPDTLDDVLQPGHLVRVSFRTAMQPAIVIALDDDLPPDLQDITTKPILALLDPDPVMTPAHIELGLWLSETYLTAPGACLWLMLPPGLTGTSQRIAHLIDDTAAPDTPMKTAIVDALREQGSTRVNQLSELTGYRTAASAARELANEGIIRIEARLKPPTVSPKTVRTVQRAIPADDIDEAIDRQLSRAPKQRRVFSHIAQFEYPLDVPDVYEATGATSTDLNNLADKGLVTLDERIVYRDSLADSAFVLSEPPPLTSGQAAVWQVIHGAMRGETGSKNDPTLTLPAGGEGIESNMTHSRLDSTHSKSRTDTPEVSEVSQPSALERSIKSVRIRQSRTSEQQTPPPFTGEAGRGSAWRQFSRWRTPPHLWRKLRPLARKHRQNPTLAENTLWQHLRKRQRKNIKFRRQHTIGRFIVDFFAPEIDLILEVDGLIHQRQKQADALRQAFLENRGYRVLRITNQDIYTSLADVIQRIEQAIDDQQTTPKAHKFLLHGVTGSGKTEIYLRAIAETLQQGRQAIFLVPEIALTPQTIRRVSQRFPDKVAVVHGSLSRGERYDTWRRARNGEIPVIVGTRSALFTPLPDCGLIVLDEEHDSSYKQTPPLNPPYYHARAVAEKMVALNPGTLILGSATPDLETRYRAAQDDLTYLHLPDRIMGHRRRLQELAQQQNIAVRYQPAEGEAMTMNLPPVLVVDMRDELKAGNTTMFSRDLQAALQGVLARDEQAMLFLNRRGQSTYVFCRDCGYVVECDNCDTPLTYHRQGEAMRCHHCGFQTPAPEICPVCDSNRIRYFGAGTQHVERAVQKHFSQARTVRWDADTASSADLHEQILGRFMAGEANVLIGTQMIAKGLDLPRVTLVGVVSADPGLAMPDFRADERAFQLLTQVAGRAGRGVLGGEVIIQTYQPQHRAIIAAAQHDYSAFYEDEIDVRRRMGYPPFRRLARVLIQNTHPIEAERRANDITQHLRQRIHALEMHDTHLIGPAPCFFSRIDRYYRWQVLVRSSNPLPALQELQLVSRPDKGQTEYLDIDTLDML